LSAFGIGVPSLWVDGGKKLSLEGNMQVTERDTNGAPVQRQITKVGVLMKTLKEAVADFNTCKSEKAIKNPFGSKLGSRASSNSILHVFEKDQAANIISNMRKAVGAVQRAEQGGKRQRDEQDEEADERRKRVALFDV
jgi:hypothetical protein